MPRRRASRIWSTYASLTVSPIVIVPLSGFSAPTIMRSRVVLPAPLGPIMPTMLPGGIVRVEIFDQQPVAIGLRDILEIDHHIAQARAGRNVDLQILAALLGFLVQQVFVGGHARLALGLARLGRHADPFQLALQGLLALALGLFLAPHALLLLLQPRGVVALPRNAVAAIQLQDPAGHVVEKVAIVGDGDHGALVLRR